MDKYLGNKAKFAKEIYTQITEFSGIKHGWFFDAFAGTANMGKYFKTKNFNVISNDINDLSFVLAKCYLTNSEYPSFNTLFDSNIEMMTHINRIKLTEEFKNYTEEFINLNKHLFNKNELKTLASENFIILLTYLTYFLARNDVADLDHRLHMFVTENYTEFGSKSFYLNLKDKPFVVRTLELSKNEKAVHDEISEFLKSPFDKQHLLNALALAKNEIIIDNLNKLIAKENLVGKRMFFSREHATKIDLILNLICALSKKNLISESEYYFLLTSLLEAVCLFSNTSATYQAFYKDYRANTQQKFRLIVPQISKEKVESVIYQEDTYQLIPEVETDILYLDPPYNWRQYDSNYHLLNTIARYREIKNIGAFEKNIVGASGENRVEKLKYTSFNNNSKFMSLLLKTITSSKSKIIALSYSDSTSNHEGEEINSLIDDLCDFFSNKKVFSEFKLCKIESVNFESRKGNKKPKIHELLFLAKKAKGEK